MARKTRTVVPKDLWIETRPGIRMSLASPVHIRIVGKNDRTIARLKIGKRGVAVYGAREWNAKGWTYRELQLQGISD